MNHSVTNANSSKLTKVAPGEGRRPRPAARVVHVGNTAHLTTRPFNDDAAIWSTKLREVLGTTSDHFVRAATQQLIAANKLPGKAIACTTSLSAALAFIASLEPENEAQAALAVQLAALHSATLNVLGRIHNVGERNVVAMASAGAKLERAFQSGLETYYRIKRGTSQVIRIERVTVEAGAQAVIGQVQSG
ncbi:MAG: hypothetical protein ACK4MV_09610 [Beijerinckiaceae bacterium]